MHFSYSEDQQAIADLAAQIFSEQGLDQTGHGEVAARRQLLGAALLDAPVAEEQRRGLTLALQVRLVILAAIAIWILATLFPPTLYMILALIGLFNVFGSFAAGVMGGRWSKKYLLSALYTLRSLTILIFILMPVTMTSVMVFSAAMGILWLSTVPLTSGLVAQMFGTRYMGTLFGIVFFSHQVGSFLGVWLGGKFFDLYGTYDPIWWAGIALGLISALLHWPINEKTVPQAVNA